MKHVLIAGAGKIGSMIAAMFAEESDFQIYISDIDFSGHDISRLVQSKSNIKTVELDLKDKDAVERFLQAHPVEAVISSLPYFVNVEVAKIAKAHKLHYFDLTEDTSVTDAVKIIAQDASTAFMPQCGLAPGFIGIAANSLMKHFKTLDSVKLRVGALPQNSNNGLQYALTWSTEGLINQYGNLCHAIENGEDVILHPLEGLELLQIDGLSYEAFNTSGGLGSLAELYSGKVNHMTYKTMRYPGHCKKMRILMNDLKLNEDRETLKKILENAIPKSYQDVVVVYVSVSGQRNGHYMEENYVNKVYPQVIAGLNWSAIQVTTASGVCAVVDMVLANTDQYKGLILQETFQLDELLNNRFGKYYQHKH